MRIKTIVKWFDWTLQGRLHLHSRFISDYLPPKNLKFHSKQIRLAERALKELKKYKHL